MIPDFNQKTIDTLGKRAAFKCSNPDCRIATVGPNTDPKKSTVIGEAAHIFGARPSAKRFDPGMTDAARVETTNAIWLCRNCHKLIDTDTQIYSSDILFAWREQHETHVQSELGTATDKIRYVEQHSQIAPFKQYPPIIRRIIIDRPTGWEWRLTAELMRHLNHPIFRKLDDLRNNLYIRSQEHIDSEDIIGWVSNRLSDASAALVPIEGLLDMLTESWGAPGEPSDLEEIHHICCLIRDHLEQVLKYEEQIKFTHVPEEYERFIELMSNFIGSQFKQLSEIPDTLDELVSMIGTDHGGTEENPYIVKKVIKFDVPNEWMQEMDREIKLADRRLSGELDDEKTGVWSILFPMIILIMFLLLIF